MAENSMEVICISALLARLLGKVKTKKEACGGSEEVIFLIFSIHIELQWFGFPFFPYGFYLNHQLNKNENKKLKQQRKTIMHLLCFFSGYFLSFIFVGS